MMLIQKYLLGIGASAILVGAPFTAAQAADVPTYTLEMKGGTFLPSHLVVPAGQKIYLVVKNEEKVQTEFESYKLDKEQKIESGDSVGMFVGPLDAGEYPIFDDNNPDTTGKITAK